MCTSSWCSRVVVPLMTVTMACAVGFLAGCEASAEVDTSADRAAAPPDRMAESDMPRETRESRRVEANEKKEMKEMKETITSEMAYPTGDRKTSALLVERTAPAQVRVGRPYAYDIKVTNLTKSPLQGVVVTEEVPDTFHVSMADAGDGATTRPATRPAARAGEGGGNQYAIGELGPGESRTLRLSATTDKPDRNFSSCMSVAYNPTLCTTAMIVNPQVRLSLAAPSQIDICDKESEIKYTLTNTGTGTETDIHVEHPLPDGLQTADGKNRVAFDLPSLAQGQSREYTIKVVPQKTGEFRNQAMARTAGGDIKSDELAMKVIAPRLAVSVKAPEQDYAGTSIPYEITVKNNGDAPARDAFVRLDTAATPGTEFLGFAAPMRPDGTAAEGEAQLAAAREEPDRGEMPARQASRDMRQSLGTIEPGQSRTIRADLRGTQGGAMRINAIAEAVCAERVSAVAQTNIQTLPALLLEVIDRADPIRVGENQLYTIRVTNQGFGDDKDVQIVATLPDGEDFVQAGGVTTATADGKKITFAPIPVLKPKQTATWTVEVKAAKAGDVRFKIDLTSESLDTPATENEPTRLY